MACSIYISSLKRKKMWKPKKFMLSRRSKVAETFDQLMKK
jgi:hypothetical protein